jgi:hypothetical protein
MRDQIAEIINVGELLLTYQELADEILAALPDMIAPLVWVTTKYGVSAPDYFIMHILPKNAHRVYGIEGEWDSSAEFDTLEAAQAAANTHHRDAIMAAFTGEKKT